PELLPAAPEGVAQYNLAAFAELTTDDDGTIAGTVYTANMGAYPASVTPDGVFHRLTLPKINGSWPDKAEVRAIRGGRVLGTVSMKRPVKGYDTVPVRWNLADGSVEQIGVAT